MKKKVKPNDRRALTNEEKDFVAHYVTGNTAEMAVVEARIPTKSSTYQPLTRRGSNLMALRSVKDKLQEYATRAVDRVEHLAEGARSEYVQLEANKDILDRAGFSSKGQVADRTLIINISGESSQRFLNLTTATEASPSFHVLPVDNANLQTSSAPAGTRDGGDSINGDDDWRTSSPTPDSKRQSLTPEVSRVEESELDG